eukprot:gene7237-11555_t
MRESGLNWMLLIGFIVLITFSQATFTDVSAKKIFFLKDFGKNVTVEMLNTINSNLTHCKCNNPETILNFCQITVINQTDTSGSSLYLYKIFLTIPKTGGYCEVSDSEGNVITHLGFLEELSFYPAVVALTTTTNIYLQTKPPIQNSDIQKILVAPRLGYKLNPGEYLNMGTKWAVTLSSSFKNYAWTNLPKFNGSVQATIFIGDFYDKIFEPIQYTFTNTLTIQSAYESEFTDYYPKYIIQGVEVTYTFKGNFDKTISANARFYRSGTMNIFSDAYYVDKHTIQANFTYPTTIAQRTIYLYLRLHGQYVQFYFGVITPLRFANMDVSYMDMTKKCSIMGSNTISINTLYTSIASRKSAMLMLNESTFSVTVNCTWNSLKTTLECPCPPIYQYSLHLPRIFSFSLYFEDYGWGSSTHGNLNPHISYDKPIAFTYNYTAKLHDSISPIFKISNLGDVYSEDFNYKWFLHHKGSNFEWEISPSCIQDFSSKSFLCDAISTLTSSSLLNGKVNFKQNVQMNLSQICGCDFNFNNTICENGTISSDGKCCFGNLCHVPCFEPCELYPVAYVENKTNPDLSGRIISSNPLYITVRPQITEISKHLVTNAISTAYIMGGPFIEGNVKRIIFRPTLMVNGTPVNEFIKSKVTKTWPFYNTSIDPPEYVSSSNFEVSLRTIKFSVPKIAIDYLYDLSIDFEIHSNDILNKAMRFYDQNDIRYDRILGDSGIGKTRPEGSIMYVEGSGFFPSDKILITYSFGNLKLGNTCEYITNFNISCKTNKIDNIGIKLPQTFQSQIAINGNDYKYAPSLTFFKSLIPIIIQAIPSRGPIKPDNDYAVDIEGVTNDIDICVWTSKTQRNIYQTQVPVLSNSRIKCPVPSFKNLKKFDETDFGKWDLHLYNSLTTQVSPKYKITFYDNPVVTSISPSFGKAVGDVHIHFKGTGFDLVGSGLFGSGFEMKFKISNIVSNRNCIIHNSTDASCITPAHPEDGEASLFLSFNNYQFIDINQKYRVDSCYPGYTGVDFENPCEPCLPGTYKAIKGFVACFNCPFNSYQPLSGSSSCLNCPERTRAFGIAKNITDCDCIPGSWRRNGTTSGVKCEECVDGGICLGKNSFPFPEKGYYWKKGDVENLFNFVKCRNADWCTGNTTFGQEGCIIGRTGLLCEECAAGYFKSSGRCELCNTDVQWRMIFVVGFLVILILLFFKFAQLKVSHLSSFSIAVSYYQIIAIFSAYNFKWPDALKNVLASLKFLNLDLDIFVPECISVITYAMKWAATICIPIIFAVGLILGFVLECVRSLFAKLWGTRIKNIMKYFYKVNRRNWLTKYFSLFIISILDFIIEPKTTKELKEFGDKCIHTFVIVILFSYVFVVTKSMQIFNCTEIDGVLRMESEKSKTTFGMKNIEVPIQDEDFLLKSYFVKKRDNQSTEILDEEGIVLIRVNFPEELLNTSFKKKRKTSMLKQSVPLFDKVAEERRSKFISKIKKKKKETNEINDEVEMKSLEELKVEEVNKHDSGTIQ